MFKSLYDCVCKKIGTMANSTYGTLCATTLLAIAYLMQSPLNPFASGVSKEDSSVFRFVGRAISMGGMPYRETFDHKGPLLYLYNWLGMCINPLWGVWLIEVLSLTAFLILVYRIAFEVSATSRGHIVQLVTLLALLKYFQGGNLVEEYALPFIGYSLLAMVRLISRGAANVGACVGSGMCLGCVLMLRPNMFGMWCGFGLSVCVAWMLCGNLCELAKSIAWLVAGLFGVIVVAVCVLAMCGVLFTCLDCYIAFNMRYTSAFLNAHSALNGFQTFVFDPLVLGTLGLSLWLATSSGKPNVACFWWGLFSAMAISLLLVCMSGNAFSHYGMVLVPLFVPVLAHVDAKTCKLPKRVAQHIFTTAVCLAAVSLGGVFAAKCYWTNALSPTRKTVPNDLAQICETVKARTSPRDRIAVWGNLEMVYLLTGRDSATRWSYTTPVLEVDPIMADEYFNSLEQARPKVIVARDYVVPSHANDTTVAARMARYLDEEGYELVGNKGDNLEYQVWALPDAV